MHFYEWNIGDYAKKTQHLTNEEDLAYRRLLDIYYDTENPPLTDGLSRLSRRLKVTEEVLKNVLDEFFPDGRNKHADEKIAAYYEYIAKQQANGKKGGRPKNNPPLTHRKPTAKPTTNHESTDYEPLESTPLVETPDGVTLIADEIKPVKREIVPFAKIVDLYHEQLPMLPTVAHLNEKRKGCIRSRWQDIEPQSVDDGLNEFKCYFDMVAKSKFLTGKVSNGDRKPFRANLMWLMNESNYLKVIEGNYHA